VSGGAPPTPRWAPPPARLAALAAALADLLAAVQAETVRATAAVNGGFALMSLAGALGGPGGQSRPSPPFPPSTRVDALPPALRAAAERAPATLAKALDAPPAAPHRQAAGPGGQQQQHALPCGLPLPAVGGHRVAAARLAAALLSLRLPAVDARLAASGVLPRVLGLATAHGHCSPLHAAALACLGLALGSGCPRLWGPLFEPWAAGGEGGGGGDAAAAPPAALPARLAAVLGDGGPHDLPPGARPPGVGWAVAAAGLLLDTAATAGGTGRGATDPPPPPPATTPVAPPPPTPAAAAATAAALAACPAWAAVSRGALKAYRAEQAGDLLGPRPARGGPFATAGQAGQPASDAQREAARTELLRLLSQMRMASGGAGGG